MKMTYRLQNQLAASSVTLPAACVAATLLWWLPQGGYSTDYLLGWLACAFTTYIFLESAAVNALIRIRSRMISSLFLLLMAAVGFLHPLQAGTLAQCALVLSLYCLLRTYENPRPQADTFHTYLLVSLASLLWPPFLLLTFAVLWSQAVYLRSLGWKSFGAAVIGMILPYVFWASAAFVWTGFEPFVQHTAAIISPFTESFYWQWLVQQVQTCEWHTFWHVFPAELWRRLSCHMTEGVSLGLVLLFGLTGFVHYVRKSYDDKIRVRMCHYTYMALQFVLVCWIFLQPSSFHMLFPLLLLTTVPAAAHFIALTHTWLTNAWVVLLLLLLVVVGVYCDAILQLVAGAFIT